MSEELKIKDMILNKVIAVSFYFILPLYLIAMFRSLEVVININNIVNTTHVSLLSLIFIFRKRLKFIVKIHLFSFVFLSIGITSFALLSFGTAYFFCFVAIMIPGILSGYRAAILYIIMVTIFFSVLGYFISSGKLSLQVNLNNYLLMKSPYFIIISSVIYISALILFTSNELYKYFTNAIKQKQQKERELKIYQNQLEEKVRERTKSLEKALEDLKSTQSQLIQSEKMTSLGILSAGVAHEINNPLNYIFRGTHGIKTLMDDKECDDPDKINLYIDNINKGVDRVNNIVKTLGKYGQSESLPKSKCNLHHILDDCIGMLNFQFENRIKIVKSFSDTDAIVFGQEGDLIRSFLAILINAVQAIEGDGKIYIKTIQKQTVVKIEITDTGCGIEKDNIKYIFDPFFTTKEPGKGTGLGLSTVNKIILDHKGTISCHSEVNKGTTMTVVLPLINTE